MEYVDFSNRVSCFSKRSHDLPAVATKGIEPPSGDYRDYLSWAP